MLMVIYSTFLLSSCFRHQEGCIDPESTNYDITADNECEDCCEYPDLELSVFHENMDTTFRLEDTIVNDLGQKISLVDFVYLLSEFEITTVDSIYGVSDSISLNVDTESILVKDDVIRVNRDVFTFDLGTIIFDGTTQTLSFKVGLTDVLNENRFTTAVDDHALTKDPDSLFQSDSGTYVFQRLKVAQGQDLMDTVIYDISTSVDVSFPLEIISERGTDKKMIIEAQYNVWFDEVDFTTMDKSEIESKITSNSSKVFRVKN